MEKWWNVYLFLKHKTTFWYQQCWKFRNQKSFTWFLSQPYESVDVHYYLPYWRPPHLEWGNLTLKWLFTVCTVTCQPLFFKIKQPFDFKFQCWQIRTLWEKEKWIIVIIQVVRRRQHWFFCSLKFSYLVPTMITNRKWIFHFFF